MSPIGFQIPIYLINKTLQRYEYFPFQCIFCDGNLFSSQIENNMIDTNQLSALISAFRVETEKESISRICSITN